MDPRNGESEVGEGVAGVEHCEYCFEVIMSAFSGEEVDEPIFAEAYCPMFVTWEKVSPNSGKQRLRGCLGTLEPRYLQTALKDFALRSAFKDRRFDPIWEEEIPFLTCCVSLLCHFERAKDWQDWTIGVHGLIIRFLDPKEGSYKSATYLPQVAEQYCWTCEQTIESLIRKTGYNEEITDEFLQALEVTRYQSTSMELSHEEFINRRSNKRVQENGLTNGHSTAHANGVANHSNGNASNGDVQ